MIRRKVRVVQDKDDTKVYDQETGKEIPGVYSLDVTLEHGHQSAQMLVSVEDIDMEVWADICGVKREDLLGE